MYGTKQIAGSVDGQTSERAESQGFTLVELIVVPGDYGNFDSGYITHGDRLCSHSKRKSGGIQLAYGRASGRGYI